MRRNADQVLHCLLRLYRQQTKQKLQFCFNVYFHLFLSSVRLCSRRSTTLQEPLSPVSDLPHPHLRKPSPAYRDSPLHWNSYWRLFGGTHIQLNTHIYYSAVLKASITIPNMWLQTEFAQCVSFPKSRFLHLASRNRGVCHSCSCTDTAIYVTVL